MPFQKGNKLGQGRPPVLDKEFQSLLEGRKAEIKGYLNKYLSMTKKEMAFITEQQVDDMPLVESWIMKIVEKGHNDNDNGLLFKLIEATYGNLQQPEALTAEQRLALSLYDKWRQEQTAHLQSPPMAGESKK